jgi:hypothetical protein
MITKIEKKVLLSVVGIILATLFWTLFSVQDIFITYVGGLPEVYPYVKYLSIVVFLGMLFIEEIKAQLNGSRSNAGFLEFFLSMYFTMIFWMILPPTFSNMFGILGVLGNFTGLLLGIFLAITLGVLLAGLIKLIFWITIDLIDRPLG